MKLSEILKDWPNKVNHSWSVGSTNDQWIFWNCNNVPEILPEYLFHFKTTPNDLIGYGLSKEQAYILNSLDTQG